MKIGIIAALDIECRTLLDEMVDAKQISVGPHVFYEGQLKGKDCVVVQCGVGKVAAGAVATVLITQFGVDHLINTGSSGGVMKDVKIKDLVIADTLAYADVDITSFGRPYGQLPDMPVYYPSDPIWIEAAEKAAKEMAWAYHVGLIVTSDTFVCRDTQRANITKHFKETLACEMEGCAIAQIAYMYKIPVLVIRSISDSAGADSEENTSLDFDRFVAEVGHLAAELVLKTIEIYGE